MSDREQELLDGLHALANDGPRQAPVYVEQNLLAEFRRRKHAQRRRLFWSAGAVAAIAAGLVTLAWVRPATHNLTPTVASQNVPSVLPADDDSGGFFTLPESEALPAVEVATVIRVELPMSSLRLIGYPINEDRAGEEVVADVLLGQDGLARGVRLVE